MASRHRSPYGPWRVKGGAIVDCDDVEIAALDPEPLVISGGADSLDAMLRCANEPAKTSAQEAMDMAEENRNARRMRKIERK